MTATEKVTQKTTNNCCCSKQAQSASETPAVKDITNQEPNNLSENRFIIEGASCASCVNKIEAALNNLPRVKRAEMNFAQRVVTVTGDTSVSNIIEAVEKAGYKAKLDDSDSEQEALDEKEKADWQYYKKINARNGRCVVAWCAIDDLQSGRWRNDSNNYDRKTRLVNRRIADFWRNGFCG